MAKSKNKKKNNNEVKIRTKRVPKYAILNSNVKNIKAGSLEEFEKMLATGEEDDSDR